MKSWKTTLFGIVAALGGGYLTGIETGFIDPADFPKWARGVAFLLMTVGGGGVGIVARDNNKRSEDVLKGRSVENRNQIRLPLSLLVLTCLTSAWLVGCGTTFQERREVYRAIADRATNAVSSGRITNDMNTIRTLKSQ